MKLYRLYSILIFVGALIFYFTDRSLAYYFENILSHKILPYNIELKSYVPTLLPESQLNKREVYYELLENSRISISLNCTDKITDFRFIEYCFNTEEVVFMLEKRSNDTYYYAIIEKAEDYRLSSECLENFQVSNHSCYKIQNRDDKTFTRKIGRFVIARACGFLSILFFSWKLFLAFTISFKKSKPYQFVFLKILTVFGLIILLLIFMFGEKLPWIIVKAGTDLKNLIYGIY